MLSIFAIFRARALLVLLLLPFSALDKILNFNEAVEQAKQAVRLRTVAILLISAGLGIEIIMSLAILTGVADRLAALILSGYCVMTALLWKQFWKGGDFLKNLAVAGGFLTFTFGITAAGRQQFVHTPLASSHPYASRGAVGGS